LQECRDFSRIKALDRVCENDPDSLIDFLVSL
jgi:hypothetical protein